MELTCAFCHEHFGSVQSLKGECPECGAAICFKCWALGQRTCAVHAVSAAPASVLTPPPATSFGKSVAPAVSGVACAKCGRALPYGAVRRRVRVYCPPCQRALCCAPLPESAVAIDDARYLESLFHRFMEDALAKANTWPAQKQTAGTVVQHPMRRTRMATVPLAPVEPLPEDFVANHPCAEALIERVERMPGNRAVRFDAVYRSGRWFRRGHTTAVSFVVACRTALETLIERGYVKDAAGTRELGTILECDRMASGKERLFFAFSPTGWRKDLSVPDGTVLAWPGDNGGWKTRHRLHDETAREFVEAIFDVQSANDKAERCLERLIGESGTRFPLSASDVAQTNDIPFHAVAEVFRRIAKKESSFIVCDDSEKNDWLLEIK